MSVQDLREPTGGGTIGIVAWDWMAPMGTAVVGLAGIAATYFSGGRQAATAREVTEHQSEALLLAQREERHQRRIEAAYPALLDVLSKLRHWAMQVDEYMVGYIEERPPPMPQDEVELANQDIARCLVVKRRGLGRRGMPWSRRRPG